MGIITLVWPDYGFQHKTCFFWLEFRRHTSSHGDNTITSRATHAAIGSQQQQIIFNHINIVTQRHTAMGFFSSAVKAVKSKVKPTAKLTTTQTCPTADAIRTKHKAPFVHKARKVFVKMFRSKHSAVKVYAADRGSEGPARSPSSPFLQRTSPDPGTGTVTWPSPSPLKMSVPVVPGARDGATHDARYGGILRGGVRCCMGGVVIHYINAGSLLVLHCKSLVPTHPRGPARHCWVSSCAVKRVWGWCFSACLLWAWTLQHRYYRDLETIWNYDHCCIYPSQPLTNHQHSSHQGHCVTWCPPTAHPVVTAAPAPPLPQLWSVKHQQRPPTVHLHRAMVHRARASLRVGLRPCFCLSRSRGPSHNKP